jgi:sec-independent protein translocase protein TatA
MFGSLGVPELLIILVIIVVLFGVNKLPRLGKGLGEGIKNFKESVRPKDSSDDGDDEASDNEAVTPR